MKKTEIVAVFQASDINEVWILVHWDGSALKPIDEDGTNVFMAWPTREEAEKGLKEQMEAQYEYDQAMWPKVVKLKTGVSLSDWLY